MCPFYWDRVILFWGGGRGFQKGLSPATSEGDVTKFKLYGVSCWYPMVQREPVSVVAVEALQCLTRPPPLVVDGGRRRRGRRSSASALSSRLSCTRSRCSASRSEVQTGWSWICSCGRDTAAAAAPPSPSARNTGWSRPAGGAPLHFSSSGQTPPSLREDNKLIMVKNYSSEISFFFFFL